MKRQTVFMFPILNGFFFFFFFFLLLACQVLSLHWPVRCEECVIYPRMGIIQVRSGPGTVEWGRRGWESDGLLLLCVGSWDYPVVVREWNGWSEGEGRTLGPVGCGDNFHHTTIAHLATTTQTSSSTFSGWQKTEYWKSSTSTNMYVNFSKNLN